MMAPKEGYLLMAGFYKILSIVSELGAMMEVLMNLLQVHCCSKEQCTVHLHFLQAIPSLKRKVLVFIGY